MLFSTCVVGTTFQLLAEMIISTRVILLLAEMIISTSEHFRLLNQSFE